MQKPEYKVRTPDQHTADVIELGTRVADALWVQNLGRS